MAQSTFLKGDIDGALVKFERVLKDYPNTNAAYQSLVYLLSNAITEEDYPSIPIILSKLDNEIDKINDPVIKSALYKVQGDEALRNGDIKKAISFYEYADNNSENIVGQLRYKIDIGIALLAKDDYSSAMDVFQEVIDNEDVGYNEKNKAEELLAYVKQKLDI